MFKVENFRMDKLQGGKIRRWKISEGENSEAVRLEVGEVSTVGRQGYRNSFLTTERVGHSAVSKLEY